MDNSSVTVLGIQFEPERDSLQEPFFNEEDENEVEQEITNFNECINLDDCCPIFLEFLTTSPLTAFFSLAISTWAKNVLIVENIHFLIQNVR